MAYVTIKPGEPIPEAEFWQNRRSWIRQKFIRWDERLGTYVALKEQKIKRVEEVKETKPKVETVKSTPETSNVEDQPKKRGRPKRQKVDDE